MKEKGEIVFYQSGAGENQIEVKLEDGTIWLNINQIAALFERDKSVISRHLANVYREGELDRESTVAKNATVQMEGDREVSREVEFYNLDAILSVGYRVNSLRGTQFRIWANQVLKEYLVKGYAVDKKRLLEQARQLEELKQTVKLLGNVIENKTLNSDEANGLLKVIADYAYALDILDRYDHQVLEIEATSPKEIFRIGYAAAMEAIKGLKQKLAGVVCLGMRRMNPFGGRWPRSTRLLAGRTSIPALRRRLSTCCTL
jgi:hypothetical protein